MKKKTNEQLKKELKKLKEDKKFWKRELKASQDLLDEAEIQLDKTHCKIEKIKRELGIKPKRRPRNPSGSLLPLVFGGSFNPMAMFASLAAEEMKKKNGSVEWPDELNEKGDE